MKTLVNIGGVMTPSRAKKDERPATQIAGRGWKEIPVEFDDLPTVGLMTSSGHWLYFTTDDTKPVEQQDWYKIDATLLDITQTVIIKSAPEPDRKTPEEQKEARKARRDARKSRRKEAKEANGEHASDEEAFDEVEAKERKAMKRKAMKEKVKQAEEAEEESE